MAGNIDVHIGNKIRIRRHVLGMSQTDLGNKIGVTFQQIQKYEKGFNKIMASRLYDLSSIMAVPITYFFDDYINDSSYDSSNSSLHDEAKEFEYEHEDEANGREAIALVKVYNSISDKTTRKKLVTFLKSVVNQK